MAGAARKLGGWEDVVHSVLVVLRSGLAVLALLAISYRTTREHAELRVL